MAGKQEKQGAPPREVVATTYLGHRNKGTGKYEVHRITKYDDGSMLGERVVEHPERLVARERLTTLLMSREVLP